MKHLAHEPIGKRSEISHSEVAGWLNRLPRRAAFVRSGEDVGVIYTNDTPKPLTGEAFQARLQTVYEQTHAKYCRPKEEVERGLFGTTKDSDTPPEKPDEPEPPIRRWEEL